MSSNNRIEITFEGIRDPNPKIFTARLLRVSGAARPLLALPAQHACGKFRISNESLFMNRVSDNIRGVLPLHEVQRWGLDGRQEARIPYARARTADGCNYCFRFIFNIDAILKQRGSHNYGLYQKLLDDARMFSERARNAAGLFIPHHFGVWAAETGVFAGTVLIAVTYWAGEPWPTLVRTKYNTLENKILIGRTLEMLHDVGIQINGNMGDSGALCNVLLDFSDPGLSEDDRLSGRASCFVTGLVSADAPHNCQRRLPVLPLDCFVPSRDFGCHELANAALQLDFLPLTIPRQPFVLLVTDALEFHKKYSESEQYQYPNSSILLAQRKVFFDDFCPVYAGLAVSFDEDSEETPLLLTEIASGTQTPAQIAMSEYADAELASRVIGRFAKYNGPVEYARRRKLEALRNVALNTRRSGL
ncbi:hypothetical protein MKEN_00922800 [Mycena kentingensis (nom. inval.)]|nr:hypothetical protein MKEN_00922800 [Mycena kentingensis (nom. inval.)]